MELAEIFVDERGRVLAAATAAPAALALEDQRVLIAVRNFISIQGIGNYNFGLCPAGVRLSTHFRTKMHIIQTIFDFYMHDWAD